MITSIITKWHFIAAAAFFVIMLIVGIFYNIIEQPLIHNTGDEILVDPEDCEDTEYW